MLNPDYITGLVDGEGSFTVYVRNNSNSQRRVKVEPKFYVKLKEQDKEILYKLKKFFGCGSVYYQKDSRPRHSDCYRYEVYNRSHLNNIIVPFFKENKLKFPSKENDFKLFSKIMEKILNNDHLDDKGLEEILLIKKHMH